MRFPLFGATTAMATALLVVVAVVQGLAAQPFEKKQQCIEFAGEGPLNNTDLTRKGNLWDYYDDQSKKLGGGSFKLQVYPADREQDRLLQLFASGSNTKVFVFTIETMLNPIVVTRRPAHSKSEFRRYWLNNMESCDVSIPRIMVVASAAVSEWNS